MMLSEYTSIETSGKYDHEYIKLIVAISILMILVTALH